MSLPTAYHRHDHRRCVSEALTSARRVCDENGAKLTTIREQVLTLVWESHQPLGAYAILEKLAAAGQGRPAPPTVYRALEFLQENGLVHRIASLNAFIGCDDPGLPHHGQFLICRDCGVVVELASGAVSKAIQASAQRKGFAVESECVEVVGRCPNCRKTGRGGPAS